MRISDWSSDVCSSDLLDVEQDVVGLDQVVDRIGQLAATPVLETVDLALAALDQRLVALDHGGHLLALVRMDQVQDFVMTHVVFLVDIRQPPGWDAARSPPRRSCTDAVWQVPPPRGARGVWHCVGPVATNRRPRG